MKLLKIPLILQFKKRYILKPEYCQHWICFSCFRFKNLTHYNVVLQTSKNLLFLASFTPSVGDRIGGEGRLRGS